MKGTLRLVGILLVAALLPLPAHAESPNASAAMMAPLIVALGIVYLTRRASVGGWLFYYYLQLYGAVLLTLVLSAATVDNLQPSGWDDKVQYAWFVLSVVPATIVQALEAIFATRLLVKSQRNERNVRALRYVLVASVAISAASVAIDYYYFTENLPLSVLALIVASIWCAYFIRSKRVNYVFSQWTGQWDYNAFSASVRAANVASFPGSRT